MKKDNSEKEASGNGQFRKGSIWKKDNSEKEHLTNDNSEKIKLDKKSLKRE